MNSELDSSISTPSSMNQDFAIPRNAVPCRSVGFVDKNQDFVDKNQDSVPFRDFLTLYNWALSPPENLTESCEGMILVPSFR